MKPIPSLLALLAASCLFASFSCPSRCDDEFFIRDEVLVFGAFLSRPGPTFVVGDTLVMDAQFSADQYAEQFFRLSENGGLVGVELLRWDPNIEGYILALPEVRRFVLEGDDLTNNTQGAGAWVTGYRCPDGRCSWRAGLVLDTPGQFLVRVTAGPVDEVLGEFRYCGAPGFFSTVLRGRNPAPENFAVPLPGGFETLAEDPWQNVHYFTVGN